MREKVWGREGIGFEKEIKQLVQQPLQLTIQWPSEDANEVNETYSPFVYDNTNAYTSIISSSTSLTRYCYLSATILCSSNGNFQVAYFINGSRVR